MLYYPQLTTGAVSQFPVTRGVKMRTVANQLPSGFTIRMADLGWQKVQWQLRYSNLTDGERSSIESLFEASEGQLNTFTFLDPTDNLLMWSEDWTQPVWTADPLLQVAGGVQDPFGNSAGMQLTNTAQATQQIVQNTAGPSSFVYCYSVYVRSNVPTVIQLVMTASGQTSLTAVTAGVTWARVTTSTSLSVQQDSVGFGVELPAGAQVNVFGAQVEAQPEAGLYKRTIDLGGVYSNTRFSSDLLAFTASAVNQNACQLGLISNLN
ncbi:MAG: hypothetical protein ACLPWF_29220 [Bryobacteraceae bacterium]